MRVIMQPVEMVAKFDLAGNPQPVRFLCDNKIFDVEQVIKISVLRNGHRFYSAVM